MINPFIDPDSLTLGELAVLEEYTGFSISETLVALGGRMQAESATVLLACVFVAGCREIPGFTAQDAASIPFTTYAELDVDESEDAELDVDESEDADLEYLPPEDEVVDDGG